MGAVFSFRRTASQIFNTAGLLLVGAPSVPPVASRLPSGLKARPYTALVCPAKRSTRCGFCTSHNSTNPSVVGTIIHSEANLRRAAHAAGMPVSKLRGHVSSRPVAGALTKLGQTPLVQITVTGSAPRKVQIAANTLAQIVVANTSTYADRLISTWQEQVSTYTQSLKTIDQALKGGGLSATDKLIISIQRAQIADQLTTAKQQLAVAQEVEKGSQKTFAAATKTTAKSRRNTVIVAALLGLLLGIFAALLWEPVGRVVRRPS